MERKTYLKVFHYLKNSPPTIVETLSTTSIQNNSWNKILLVVGDYTNTKKTTYDFDLNQAVKPHGNT